MANFRWFSIIKNVYILRYNLTVYLLAYLKKDCFLTPWVFNSCVMSSPGFGIIAIWKSRIIQKCIFCNKFSFLGPTLTILCKDEIPNCEDYSRDLCTNPLYRIFREKNCRKSCKICTGNVGTWGTAGVLYQYVWIKWSNALSLVNI